MNSIHRRVFRWLVVILIPMSIGGCVGSTVIQSSHPLIAKEGTTESARVYFIRPDPGLRGVMDMPVTISLGETELLALAKGQYTLIQLRPGSVELKAESYTVIEGSMTKISSNTPVSFSAGETHYLVFELVQRLRRTVFGVESFGSGFVPRQVSRDRALSAVQGLTPVGAAVAEPIAR